MKKLIVDTNIFLRFLTNDIPEQAARVEKRFKDAEKGKLHLIVFQITLVEVLFQLEHWYRLKKNEAVEKMIKLFSPNWFEIDHKDAVFEALSIYKSRSIDFVDLMMWAIAKKSKSAILSFDKDFDKLEPKLRLNP
ncbi:hypothetical protein A3A46_00710 [Candidatus Roizmanbacteria bacterium RIFCSPLOWO2_01_FULL_37_13]|uniref:PIN domain-containing protein n=1 Tax=Candidatus Roizmanbacteria bacterium RIFCSPHIGHO2_02_FULL_38_11 TaxID=1802039 RepID=A0A1F7H232_9BACT|nr:MAG: hypothetical protein A3C25_00400 [Candidatus Roizmanbacteria bacterium RIFCSPHIGHO2_02_FULL_38_11]OGK42921.1 MAG: hypothetical protein A3A46_00710 [Candidatus Roizmanbacteria bacterium RIFCSPLOWO2_01_FULL_37_13]